MRSTSFTTSNVLVTITMINTTGTIAPNIPVSRFPISGSILEGEKVNRAGPRSMAVAMPMATICRPMCSQRGGSPDALSQQPDIQRDRQHTAQVDPGQVAEEGLDRPTIWDHSRFPLFQMPNDLWVEVEDHQRGSSEDDAGDDLAGLDLIRIRFPGQFSGGPFSSSSNSETGSTRSRMAKTRVTLPKAATSALTSPAANSPMPSTVRGRS